MAGKLRPALKKLEDKAGTAYEVLLPIKQLDEEQPKPKQKRARMGPKKTAAAQSTTEFLAAQEPQAAAQAAGATGADSAEATDVTATPHEVLDELMESAASVEVTPLTCLMLSVESEKGGVQADPVSLPRKQPLVRLCTCWGAAGSLCVRCGVGLAEAAAADATKPPCTDEVCQQRSGCFDSAWGRHCQEDARPALHSYTFSYKHYAHLKGFMNSMFRHRPYA